MNISKNLIILSFFFLLSFQSYSKTFFIPHRHPVRGEDLDAELKELQSVKILTAIDKEIQSALVEFNRFKKSFVIQSQTEIIDCLLSSKNAEFLLEGSRDSDEIALKRKNYGKYTVDEIKKISQKGDIFLRGDQETSSYLLWYSNHISGKPVNYLSEPLSDDHETRERHAVDSAKKLSSTKDVVIVFGIDHLKGFEKKGVPLFQGTAECRKYVREMQKSYDLGARMHSNILRLKNRK